MTSSPSTPTQNTSSSSSYLTYPVSYLFRRLTEPTPPKPPSSSSSNPTSNHRPPPLNMQHHNNVFTPQHRTASPFQPPPLTPLSLVGIPADTPESAQILSRALAEEIRLLVPPRLQLAETWSLVYNLEDDGVSLATLYNKCAASSVPKAASFVLVVRDGAGGVSLSLTQDPTIDLPPTLSFLALLPPQINNMRETESQTLTNHPDLRRLPNRRPSPLDLLLRHRRMFPLARIPPPHGLHPRKPPPTPISLGLRNRNARPQHHHRLPHIFDPPQDKKPTTSFPRAHCQRARAFPDKKWCYDAGKDTVQGVSV